MTEEEIILRARQLNETPEQMALDRVARMERAMNSGVLKSDFAKETFRKMVGIFEAGTLSSDWCVFWEYPENDKKDGCGHIEFWHEEKGIMIEVRDLGE